jgi:preprotein translocase subunit SecB
MPAPLQLEDVLVESMHVRTDGHIIAMGWDSTGYTDDPPQVRVEVALLSGDAERASVALTVHVNETIEAWGRWGYALELRVVGILLYEPGIDAGERDRLLSLNAPAMLYGYSRGVAAQALALTGVGRIVLPSVNFVEALTKWRAETGLAPR